jgi:hypothetical protein
MEVRFWLAVHWPHPEGSRIPWHIFLKREFEDIAKLVAPDDGVLFYETKSGKPVRGRRRLREGRQAVVAGGRVAMRYQRRPKSEAVEVYGDGSTADWAYEVPIHDLEFGQVAREDVCRILGFKSGYRMRGLGERGSGLKLLKREQHDDLLKLLRASSASHRK